MSIFIWMLLPTVYVACRFYFRIAAVRKRHHRISWLAIILPILRIAGPFVTRVPRTAGTA